jgi:hypothetical protein
VPASPSGPRLQVARCAVPDSYTSADHAHRRFRLRLRHPRAQWSRPMAAHGCSMVARMPRYAPAPSGIRSESRIPETGQNDSSRHVLSLFDSSSRRISEQSSGLLIRGFGVQVPGGAPVLTWGFTAPGHFFGSVLSPWLLRGCSRARTQQSGLVKNGPAGTRSGGMRPRRRTSVPGRRRPSSARPLV